MFFYFVNGLEINFMIDIVLYFTHFVKNYVIYIAFQVLIFAFTVLFKSSPTFIFLAAGCALEIVSVQPI